MKVNETLDMLFNQAMNMVLHRITSESTLKTEGQIGYDKTAKRAKLRTNTQVLRLITDIDAATELVKGIVQLATQAEVHTGTDPNKVITPATLSEYVTWRLSQIGPLQFKGGYTPALDLPAADSGHMYKVTSAGRIGLQTGGVEGVDYILAQVGDTLVCVQDGSPLDTYANVKSNWLFLQTNIDQATETIMGIALVATTAKMQAMSDDQAFVTPLKLKQQLSWLDIPKISHFTVSAKGTAALDSVDEVNGKITVVGDITAHIAADSTIVTSNNWVLSVTSATLVSGKTEIAVNEDITGIGSAFASVDYGKYMQVTMDNVDFDTYGFVSTLLDENSEIAIVRTKKATPTRLDLYYSYPPASDHALTICSKRVFA